MHIKSLLTSLCKLNLCNQKASGSQNIKEVLEKLNFN